MNVFSAAKVQKHIHIFIKKYFFFVCLNKNDYLCRKIQ
jgi:hypothetical protein